MSQNPIKIIKNNKFVLLVGSAISIFKPTFFKSGLELTENIIDFLLQNKYPESLKKHLLNIPLESLLDTSWDLQKTANFIKQIYGNGRQNIIHQVLFDLLINSKITSIITTNYDLMLEYPGILKTFEETQQNLLNNYNINRIIYEDNRKKGYNDERVLFKIHGSVDDKNGSSLVFNLHQEVGLPLWKRKILKELINDKILLVMGYSGLDFDLCSEIVNSTPNMLIWNTLNKETLTQNAKFVIKNTKSMILEKDLRDVLSIFNNNCINSSINSSYVDIAPLIYQAYGKDHLFYSLWLGRFLSVNGLGKYSVPYYLELMEEYGDSFSEKAKHEILIGIAEGYFHIGKYLCSWKSFKKSASVFTNKKDNYHNIARSWLDAAEAGRSSYRYYLFILAMIKSFFYIKKTKPNEGIQTIGRYYMTIGRTFEKIYNFFFIPKIKILKTYVKSRALNYYNKASDFFKTEDNIFSIRQIERYKRKIYSLDNPANVNFDSVESFIDLGERYQHLGFLIGEINSHRDHAIELLSKNELNDAEESIFLSIEKATSIDDFPGLAKAYKILSLIATKRKKWLFSQLLRYR